MSRRFAPRWAELEDDHVVGDDHVVATLEGVGAGATMKAVVAESAAHCVAPRVGGRADDPDPVRAAGTANNALAAAVPMTAPARETARRSGDFWTII